jgi:hypothetical protein
MFVYCAAGINIIATCAEEQSSLCAGDALLINANDAHA